MKAELKAVYNASLSTASHAALYRFPQQTEIQGNIGFNLMDVDDYSEGFYLTEFNVADSPKIIPNDISIRYNKEISLQLNLKNNFTKAFEKEFHRFLASEAMTPFPFISRNNVHLSGKLEYISAVNDAIARIAKGDLQKVVISRVSQISFDTSLQPVDLFIELCTKYPGAFVSLISSPSYGTWLGATPEILLHQNLNQYNTVAVAGTKKSDSSKMFSSKEIEEQNITKDYIVDILAGFGIQPKVSAASEYDVGTLTHLKTTIDFSAPARERFSLARALHPTPAVCGFPKLKALTFLKDYEKHPRELYSGAFGVVSKHDLKLYVNIRCMQWYPHFAYVYAGAGITGASNAEAEWEETENKTQVIASVL